MPTSAGATPVRNPSCRRPPCSLPPRHIDRLNARNAQVSLPCPSTQRSTRTRDATVQLSRPGHWWCVFRPAETLVVQNRRI
jgi:hypothetical protein